MSDLLTADTIGNIVIFLAPGYISRQIYRSVFVKKELGDTSLVITSAVYSLPIVVIGKEVVTYINQWWLHNSLRLEDKPSNFGFVVILLVLSFIAGYGAVLVRSNKMTRRILNDWGFRDPEPNIYLGAMKVDHKFSFSIVTLKSGRVFGGIMTRQQTDDDTEAKALYFSHLRWRDPTAEDGWGEEANAGMLVPLDSIRYIELGPPPDKEAYRETTVHHRMSAATYGHAIWVLIAVLVLASLLMVRS